MKTQVRVLSCSIILGFIVALLRFFDLQLLKKDFFTAQAHKNVHKLLYLAAPRGVIFDAEDKIIASNRLTYCAVVRTQYSKKRAVVEDGLAEARKLLMQVGNVNIDDINVDVKSLAVSACNLSLAQVEKIHDLKLQGINVELERSFVREIKDISLAHVIGYLGQGNASPLRKATGNEKVGITGVEKCLNEFLSGIDGITRSVVNVRAEAVSYETVRRPKPGLNVKLTIDSEWQRFAFEAMKDYSGAVVVMDVNSGGVKVLLSTPVFDPNIFNANRRSEIAAVLKNPAKPLLNRAVNGVYPPGSVIKMFAALGLSTFGKTLDQAHCPGFDYVAGRRIHCHNRSGHGNVDLVNAIAKSCDVYFYKLSKLASYDEIFSGYHQFGFGTRSGIDCFNESAGILLPRERIRHSIEFEKAVISIGQGAIATTPLQVAVALAALVNGGKILQPRIVDSIYASNWITDLQFSEPVVVRNVNLDQHVLNLVKKGMFDTVNSPFGTAFGSKSDQVTFAGKTGTAQVVELRKRGEFKSKRFDHHAWFVGYWPVNEPRYVIVVIVEHGGSGGKAAAPVAREIIEKIHRATS